MPDFFRLYYDELMKKSQIENDTKALFEAGFIESYVSKITSPYFLEKSKEEHSRLQTLVPKVDPRLQANVEGRCKSAKSAIDKAKKYIDNLDEILDIHAFRIVIYGPYSEQELVHFCYALLDKVAKFYLSQGYIMCKATPVTDTLDKQSSAYKKLITPTDEDRKLINWISPHLLKDYIDSPKSNLYQSLHVAFRDPHGFTFELQIRTFMMDVRSKEGTSDSTSDLLSHPNYKANKYPNASTFDRSKVKISGYTVVLDLNAGKEVVHDKIGLELPKPIVSGQ